MFKACAFFLLGSKGLTNKASFSESLFLYKFCAEEIQTQCTDEESQRLTTHLFSDEDISIITGRRPS
jgi:hypothetical protein